MTTDKPNRARKPRKKKCTPTGQFLGRLSRQDYEAIRAVNYSTLKHMATSPMHYLYYLTHKQESDDFTTGAATHTAILEPRRFQETYVVQPEYRTNDKGDTVKFVRSGAHWEEYQSANPGKTILTKAQYDAAWDMQESVRKHAWARDMLLGCERFEEAVQWADKSSGTPCKGILDACGGAVIVDLKTSRSPSPRDFERECARYRYHWQAAMYCDAYEAITGTKPKFYYIVAAKIPPIDVVVYAPDEAFIEEGRAQYRAALERLQICQSTNQWPGLASDIQPLSLPPWAFDDQEAGDVLAGINQEN